MTRQTLTSRLGQGLFFVDGAMGTQLIEQGARAGGCNDMLNLDSPALVRAVHQRYLDAGVDAVITNTFGANALSLGRYGLADKTYAVNRAGAELARQTAGDDRYVLGDIGPCGDFLEPLGTITGQQLLAAFARQAEGLRDGGVDGFIIETMTALEEVRTAIAAVRTVSDDLPILVSLAYDAAADGRARTMMGITPAQAVEYLSPLGIAGLGFNCGTLDMAGYVKLAGDYAAALKGTGLLLLAEPNAGRPHLEGDKAVYTLSPDAFALALVQIRQAGASILGGCCGTSPAHLSAAVQKLTR
ncbi:MAG TPA: homocysteine S-methyltransferase family protein [Anaerohalosphaeraceae bacterium]|nr:homocysteine S-methyltransferase family protein [Phycisphaerae bacterium]HOL31878.1 homocysteine S-methyltransferase family protein [Anaerohalosphaeraceae bacterium]HOM75263.1 homocysteine S-methyltransferase family protein [Anaerohalosphaeraceae bacterium]HPC65354.1 homocysteine S-methyltransferase family protein [Anaerohalosphaeraceae bacterium]HPO70256.1 homocysteine S-methyltransferase family protein [Anaerohalosphaeraceae bacterium]